MKILPKILIIIASVLLVLGVGAGIYFFRDKIPFLAPKPEKVTLTYWGLFEPPEVMSPLIEEYQRENPHVQINYQLQSYSTFKQYKETLYTRVKQDGGPDIARIHSSWSGQFENLISPLPSSVMSTADFGQRFFPVATKACQIGGNSYCLPLMYDGLTLVYNKRTFSEAAITAPPRTWKEFRDIAVKLTQWEDNDPKNRILQAGAAVGAGKNVDQVMDILGLMLAQSEVSIPTQLSSQAAQDVFTFYTNFTLKDHVWDETWPSSLSAFASGKVGMIFIPSWGITLLKDKDLNFGFGVAPVPQVPKLEGGLTEVGWANFWVETVFSDGDRAKEAWKFLKFLSEREAQETLFSRAKKIRGLPFPYGRKDLASGLSGDPYLGPVVEYATVAETSPIASCSGNPDYEEVLLGAVEEILSRKPVREVLVEAQDSLVSLLGSKSLGISSEETECVLTSFGLGIVPEIEAEEPMLLPTPEPTTVPEATPTPTPTPTGAPAPVTEVEALKCLSLSATPKGGEIPLKVTFTARASDTARAEAYRFAFGDGQVDETSVATTSHTYSSAGTYTASVRVKDSAGVLTPETSLCQATISARRPAKVATPSAKPTLGFTLPLVAVSFLGILLLTLGLLF